MSSIRCSLARPRSLVGGKPTRVAVSHGPGIQPCRYPGNPAYQRDLMRRQERERGAMGIPPQAGLTVKALSPDKTAMGEVDGVYGPAGDSPLYGRGECKGPGVTVGWLRSCGTARKPGGNREDKHQPVPLGEPGLLTKSWHEISYPDLL